MLNLIEIVNQQVNISESKFKKSINLLLKLLT